MKRALPFSMAAAFMCLAVASLGAQGVFADGRWEGEADFGEGPEPLVLRIFAADALASASAGEGPATGGLLDLPARRLFGYPLERVLRELDGIKFSLQGGAPIDGSIEFKASSSAAPPGGQNRVVGVSRLLPGEGDKDGEGVLAGPFTLSYSGSEPREIEFGLNYLVDTGRGRLPGSLVLPEALEDGRCPIALILSGANADRDGNNYSVPGRSDALAELAISLKARGIASLRFDQRGTGEAYTLAKKEEDLRFDDRVEDARAAIAALSADPRFSRVAVVGYGEGALVGAAALGGATASGTAPGAEIDPLTDRVAGLAALCASGKNEQEIIQDALASTPEDNRTEAKAIMETLRSGGTYPNPSPYFADFFRPSVQPYLASLFKYDIRAAFASARIGSGVLRGAVVIAGGSDLQVKPEETELLASARPFASYRVISGMSHALKNVGDDEEANYSSFTDPALPLAQGLVDLLEAFIKGYELPGSDPRDGLVQAAADPAADSPSHGPEDTAEELPR